MGAACSGVEGANISRNESDDLDRTITEKWTGSYIIPTDVQLRQQDNNPTSKLGRDYSPDLQKVLDISQNGNSSNTSKMRVAKASRVLVIGDHRVKVATALYIKRTDRDVDVIVGVRDPTAPGNAQLRTEGIQIMHANLQTSALYNSIKRLDAIDCAFIVSPATSSKIQETCQAINSLKRAGVTHIVILSNTVVERRSETPTIFGDQCRSIETYVQRTGLSYTIVRVPIYMENYCSQIESICANGIFYRPVEPSTMRNTICIADLAEAVGRILLTPLPFADQIISLNGPQTSCELAAKAFSLALGKAVVYEKVSKSAYKSMMLNSLIPEWQAEGLLQMFESYDNHEPYCQRSTRDLETILGRPPIDVFHFARLVIVKLQSKNVGGITVSDSPSTDNLSLVPHPTRAIRPSIDVSVHLELMNLAPQGLRGVLNISIGLKQNMGNISYSPSVDHSLHNDSMGPSPRTTANNTMSTDENTLSVGALNSLPPVPTPTRTIKINTSKGVVGEIVLPDHHNSRLRSTSGSSNMGTGHEEVADFQPSIRLNHYGSKYTFLLDGILTYVPVVPVVATSSSELLDVGRCNKSFSLSGFVLEREEERRLRLVSSKGEDVVYILELGSAEEAELWLERIQEHIDHCDKSRSIWMF